MEYRQNKILFPIDFSDRCVKAARHVKMWADRLNAVLTTLHVVDPRALGYSLGRNHAPFHHDVDNWVTRRTADLKHFSDRYFGENAACPTVLTGGAADRIEHLAGREKFDLIMLPRTHQGIGARVLGDSLAATLLERSASSLWITEHEQARDGSSVHGILCAVHFERDLTLDFQNYRILEKVRSLTDIFQTKVTFLNVLDGREEENTQQTADAKSSSGLGPWLVRLREQFGNGVEFLRQRGSVVSTIADLADRVDADLVVVGRTRPGTIGLGVQSRILEIDSAVRRPILSVR